MFFCQLCVRGKAIFDFQHSQYSCADDNTNSYQRHYYCEEVYADSCKTTMPVIDNTGKQRFIYPRAPCLSQDYIQTTANIFNEFGTCFNLSHKELENLFAIINHESAFITNSRSSTGARCAGQITVNAFLDLNAQIVLNYDPVRTIYNQATDQCPGLSNTTVPSNIHNHEQYQNISYDNLVKRLSRLPITCPLTLDMSRCFFYSFLYYTTALHLFRQYIEPIVELLHPYTLEKFKFFLSAIIL